MKGKMAKGRKGKAGLTPKQRKTAERLASPEFTGSITELCKEMNISRSTYYNWMDSKLFSDYINLLIEKYTDTSLIEAWKSLVGKVKGGETSAIKLFFELKNKYSSGAVNITFVDDLRE